MRTVSTFSLGAFAAELAVDPAAVDPVEGWLIDDEFSSVPVISTLWPTWALSFDASSSRRYVLPAVAAEAVDPAPAVPVGFVAVLLAPDDPDIEAFVRMKFAAVELDAAPVVPEVPVAPEVGDSRWMQPVTVT